MGGASQFLHVRDIIVELVRVKLERPVIVVSAMSGVTSKLYACAAALGMQREEMLSEVLAIHLDCVEACLGSSGADLKKLIANDVASLIKNKTDFAEGDVVASFGEIWSSQILAALLNAAGIFSCWIDARAFLFLLHPEEEVRVDWKRSHAPLVPSQIEVPVITGFLASAACGRPTTLKRNGSDHSGAIVANLVSAKSLTIWTDVDGIFSADPRLVQDAKKINRMSYREAAELAYFGAKVIHPQTVAPCVTRGIQVVLRNTFNLLSEGTVISESGSSEMRAVTIIPQVALLNVEGSGLFGFSGIAAKLFAAVAAAKANIIMITQASSEYSICFAVPFSDGPACLAAVEKTFSYEIDDKSLQVSLDEAAIVAAVGDGMHKHRGLLGRLASALGEAGVNIRALAQGSSERNITFVVNAEDGVRALNSVHSAL